MKRRVTAFFLLGILAVFAVVYIVRSVGAKETWDAVRDAGLLAVAAMLALSLVWLAFMTLAWDLLGRAVGHRVPFLTLYGGILVGFVGNYVAPSMYLGGEPLRIAYVGRKSKLPYYQVAGTVILSKYLEFTAFVVLICIGAGVALFHYGAILATPRFHFWRGVMVAGAAAMVAVLVLLMISLRGRRRPMSAVVAFLGRKGIFRHRMQHWHHIVAEMEDQISHAFNHEWRRAWPAAVALCAGFATVLLRPLMFFLLLKGSGHYHFTFAQLCLIYTLTQFILAFHITPGSLGVYEGGMLGIFAILGNVVPREAVLAYVFCLRLADVVLIVGGIALATHQGIKIMRVARNGGASAENVEAVGRAAATPDPLAPAKPDDVRPPASRPGPFPPAG